VTEIWKVKVTDRWLQPSRLRSPIPPCYF